MGRRLLLMALLSGCSGPSDVDSSAAGGSQRGATAGGDAAGGFSHDTDADDIGMAGAAHSASGDQSGTSSSKGAGGAGAPIGGGTTALGGAGSARHAPGAAASGSVGGVGMTGGALGGGGRIGSAGSSGRGSAPGAGKGGGGADGEVGKGGGGGKAGAAEGAPGLGGAEGHDAGPSSGAGGAVGAANAGRCDGIARAPAVAASTAHLDIGAHDPSMIWDGSRYYLFVTGATLGVRRSTDMKKWAEVGSIFNAVPTWITAAIGAKPSDLWAPDISYFNGEYHLYYAGSTFGSRDSVIGLVTSATLEPNSWTDRGLVVQSKSSDNFNAIDPNVAFDEVCTPWLAYGSFWTGIRLVKLDGRTGKPKADDSTVYSIASRNGGAIEAPSIVFHNGYYYLFVSFDKCCDGVNSTYRTMVGRATKITGPYANKAGADMMKGAGEQLLASSGRYIGPGGGTAWANGDAYWYAYHYYDGQANGASKLAVRPIAFTSDDWAMLGDPVFP